MAETTSKEPLEELRKLFENSPMTMNEEPTIWVTSVRDKLYSMFCSHMKEDFIHEAFKWVSHLCISMNGFSWISLDDKWSEHECKIFSCVALLSMVDLQILMPVIQRHLTCGDEPEMEDGKVLARSAGKEDYDRFGNHLVIMESIIKALVKGQEFDTRDDDRVQVEPSLASSLNGNDLKNILDKLKETMTIISDYLECVHRHWQQLIDKKEDERFISSEGALRLMCVWLSEEPECFEAQCKRFLVDLLIKNLLLKNKEGNHDLLVLALHSVCTHDNEIMSVMRNTAGYKEALEEYLKYVTGEQNSVGVEKHDRRTQKMFKLRCGLVKDLMLLH